MAFPRSIPSNWVVRSVASPGTKLEKLLPFQFGIFDEDTHEALSAASAQKRRRLYLAVGSPNQKQFTQGTKVERLSNSTNADVTFRTEPFSRVALDTIRFQIPKKGEKPNVYYLGYNGIDSCESLKFDCGKTYQFNVLAKGRPVRNVFFHEMRENIEVTTDCCADCPPTNCDSGVGCEKYIDQLVDNFNNSLWVGRFFHAEKVISCQNPAYSQTPAVTFLEYELTVLDEGDEIALSKVQNAYPTLEVTVKRRVGAETTYSVTKVGVAPANFVQGATVIPNCETCPAGYTLTASGYAAIVEIDNANPANPLTAVQAVWSNPTFGVTSATVIKFGAGTSQYHVVSNKLLTAPPTGVDANIVMQLGTTESYCTKDSATTYSWSEAVSSSYKITRDVCLTIKVDDCDTNATGARIQAALLASLSQDPTYVSGSLALDADSTDCLLRFTAQQYSANLLQDGCDTYAVAKFEDFATFEGAVWTVCPCEGWTVNDNGCPVPEATTDNCCQCGIKFTGRPTTEILDAFPGYDINAYLEKEPIELHITVYRNDEDTRICDLVTPTWLHAQRATFRQLRGDDVVKNVIRDRMYNKELWVNQIDKENQLFLKREGIKIGVDVEAYYYAVEVYYNNDNFMNYTASNNALRESVTLYVQEEDVVALEQLKTLLTDSFQEAKLENFV